MWDFSPDFLRCWYNVCKCRKISDITDMSHSLYGPPHVHVVYLRVGPDSPLSFLYSWWSSFHLSIPPLAWLISNPSQLTWPWQERIDLIETQDLRPYPKLSSFHTDRTKTTYVHCRVPPTRPQIDLLNYIFDRRTYVGRQALVHGSAYTVLAAFEWHQLRRSNIHERADVVHTLQSERGNNIRRERS